MSRKGGQNAIFGRRGDNMFTTLGLSRFLCKTCNEETIHRGVTCIHCGGIYEQPKATQLDPRKYGYLRARCER